MRRTLLIAVAVLLVSQLAFAQRSSLTPDRTMALQSIHKAQVTGKPQPLVPTPQAGMKARPLIWVTGQKWNAKLGPQPKLVPSEPWFCDYNTGNQVAICPKGLQTAYQTNFAGANGGAGMTIAIFDYYAYPNAEADLHQFSMDMHLPDCTTANGCFTNVNLSGGYDGTGTGWDLESMLDLEYAHAMAPNAHIVYVQANPNGDGGYEEQVAQSLGDVVSNSWVFIGEYPYWETNLGFGPPVLFASGDWQAFPLSFISYPCTSPQTSCIGGTSLYLNSNLTRVAEYGWAGAGGGCSADFTMPPFQGSVGSNACAPTRATPDFSAVADPNTPVAVFICNAFYGCGYYGVGGTSAATPIMAGLVADMDTARVSFGKGKLNHLMNYYLYPAAAYNYNYYFFDVLLGNNGYPAGPKFDLVTGLGVPNGKNLGSRFFGLP